jgi:Ca2+-dependent lipid-binding protein
MGYTANEHSRAVNKFMGDPRNVAHAKKVSQEKHHKDKHASKTSSASSQRAKNVQTEKKETAPAAERTTPKAETAKPTQPLEPTQLEKSLVVLSKLKELEFHSRANIEKLAELSLTIEEELKQKAFAEAIGTVYATQDAFQSKIVKLIEDYEAECTRLKPAG